MDGWMENHEWYNLAAGIVASYSSRVCMEFHTTFSCPYGFPLGCLVSSYIPKTLPLVARVYTVPCDGLAPNVLVTVNTGICNNQSKKLYIGCSCLFKGHLKPTGSHTIPFLLFSQ